MSDDRWRSIYTDCAKRLGSWRRALVSLSCRIGLQHPPAALSSSAAVNSPMSPSADEAPSNGKASGAPTASDIAKWLVPSATILFGVLGYVIQSGQDSLLGFETSDRSVTAYINTSADFVRDAVVMLLSRLEGLTAHPLDGSSFDLNHPILLVYSIFALIVVVMLLIVGKFPTRLAAYVAIFAVFSIIFAKFITLDAPILDIEGLISSYGDSPWALVAPPEDTSTAQASDSGPSIKAEPTGPKRRRGIEDLVRGEALELFGEMVCSRTGPSTAGAPAVVANNPACGPNRTKADNQRRLDDNFVCNLIVQAMAAAGAVIVFARAPHQLGAALLCLIVLFYSLTTPYAYGKLRKATLFDMGDARISETLQRSYTSEDPNILTEKGWLPGILLQKTDKGLSVLTMRTQPCPEVLGGPQPAPKRSASFSYVASDQLLSFDEIYKVDVIYWAAENQQACPS